MKNIRYVFNLIVLTMLSCTNSVVEDTIEVEEDIKHEYQENKTKRITNSNSELSAESLEIAEIITKHFSSDRQLPINKEDKNLLDFFTIKEMFKSNFQSIEILSDTEASYMIDDDKIEVVFDTIIYYTEHNNEIALVLFKNYRLSESGYREECRACSGFLSVAKYSKKSNLWKLDNFFKECDCGSAPWGVVNIPKIIKIQNKHFFVTSTSNISQGYYYERLNICNTYDFKSSLNLFLAKNNISSGNDEMYFYEGDFKFFEKKGEVYLRINKRGSRIDDETEKVINFESSKNYLYDENTKMFHNDG